MPASSPIPLPLNVREDGEGPAVLLLHGLGGDHTVWNEVARDLGPAFHVLAPDLRGHGRSAMPAGAPVGFEAMQADLRRLLEDRGISKAHVVGISAGGFLALHWLLAEPDRFSSAVLVGSSPHCDAHTRAVAQSWAEALKEGGSDALALRLLKDLFYPDWIEAHLDYADELRKSLNGRDFAAATRWGESVRSFDLRGRLGRIRTPTLVLHGMDDRVVDSSHARLLRVSIPGAELKLFARTGHLIPVERSAEVGDTLRTWFQRVESPFEGARKAAG